MRVKVYFSMMRHILLFLILPFITSCVFIPQQVDIDAIESRIAYPRESFKAGKLVQYEKFVDLRPVKDALGSRRNLMMMRTASVSLKGDAQNLIDVVIKKTLASRGISEGVSSFSVRGRTLEVTADHSGPVTVFVKISLSLSIIDNKLSKIVYQKNLTGYSESKATIISSDSWEDAFVGAMNQIIDHVDQIALEVFNVI